MQCNSSGKNMVIVKGKQFSIGLCGRVRDSRNRCFQLVCVDACVILEIGVS